MIRVGSRVERALVMSVSKRQVVTISMKPLLLAAAGGGGGNTGDANAGATGTAMATCPSKVTELVPGMVVVGFIVKVSRQIVRTTRWQIQPTAKSQI